MQSVSGAFADHWLLTGGWRLFGLMMLSLGLVWFINLYNFMDGVDGLAASQCVVFCLGCLLLKTEPVPTLDVLLWVLTGGALGFLAFNWSPARIFMGDVGSGYLGLVIGGAAIYLALADLVPAISVAILLAVFLFDASCTLGVRVLTKQRFTEGHRSHLYQKIAERLGHQGTTLTFLAYAVLWLLPNAALAQQLPRFSTRLSDSWLAYPSRLAVIDFVRAWSGTAAGAEIADKPDDA